MFGSFSSSSAAPAAAPPPAAPPPSGAEATGAAPAPAGGPSSNGSSSGAAGPSSSSASAATSSPPLSSPSFPSPTSTSSRYYGGGGGPSSSRSNATTTTTNNNNNNAAGPAGPAAGAPPPAALNPTLPSASTQLHIAEARAALVASMSNLLDSELQGRAALLHGNAAALERQERDVAKGTEALRRENDKLARVARDAGRRIKELGNVQNWAEVLERDFLVLEETVRLVREGDGGGGGGGEDDDGSASWSGSSSYWSGSRSGSEAGSRAGSRRGSVGGAGADASGSVEQQEVVEGASENVVGEAPAENTKKEEAPAAAAAAAELPVVPGRDGDGDVAMDGVPVDAASTKHEGPTELAVVAAADKPDDVPVVVSAVDEGPHETDKGKTPEIVHDAMELDPVEITSASEDNSSLQKATEPEVKAAEVTATEAPA